MDNGRSKRLKLTSNQHLNYDSQPSPAKQPTKIKLSFKLGASKRQEQNQNQEYTSTTVPVIASLDYAHRNDKQLFSGNGGDGYLSSYSDDEPVDIDDDHADMTKDRDIQLYSDNKNNSKALVVPQQAAAASQDASGNHTPRIKLRFSLKQSSQPPPAKDSRKAGVSQPLTITSTPLQADTTAASSCAGWGSDYGSVVPGSPSGSVASNVSLSSYKRRVSAADSVSRGMHSGMYSPSLASEDESEDSEVEVRHNHTFEHMSMTPASASASASASVSASASASMTPAPSGGVRRRGRPPLRGRRSSSISSWHARGNNQVAAKRKQYGFPQGSNTTTVSLKSSLARLIKRIRKRDSYGFFLEPVDTKVITDYLTVIKNPMDLGTIQRKVETHSYKSIAEFRRDIEIVCENARKYNGDGSIYARSADRVQEYAAVAIERETAKLERVGMASISGHIGDNNDHEFAYRSRSRSNSRSRSRSRSLTPSQYNSAAEDQSDSIVGRDHRRSSRLRWRGASTSGGGISDVYGAAAANVSATPASIVDVFKWSGNSKKKYKRGSNVPKRITESQIKVHILPDGSIDPVGFEEDVALIPYETEHTALPLLVGNARSLGSSAAGSGSMAKPYQGQVNAYGQLFSSMSFADIGPYSKIHGQSLKSVSAGLSDLGVDLQPIHGDSLGMAYWASVGDFIDGAGDDVAEYATTVMDHLTNGSHRVARDTLRTIADHKNNKSADEQIAITDAKRECSSNGIDIARIVRWLDSRGARDRLFAERVDALTKKILLSELLTEDDSKNSSVSKEDAADSAKPPDYISDAQRDKLFDDITEQLRTLYELENRHPAAASADKSSRDSVSKQIQANISKLSQQMCMSLAGSHLPNTLVPGLSLPTKSAVVPTGNALPKYPFTAASAASAVSTGFPLSGKHDVIAGKGDVVVSRPSRTVSSPSLSSLHSGLPLRQTFKPL
ncbi:hypothetical protein J3B02_002886 [Coemansia erecta]|nr:hypothetical protein J3B02_002886 [Coemansia erecta]